MFKRFLQSLSTLLVLVLLVNMLPMQALADLQLDATDNVSPVTEENVAVVAEIPEGRSEYTKEFLLSNGLHLATVYAEPVHYEKDGKWEDIDNTLVTHIDGTYKNTAGVWDVSFPQSFGSAQSISITKDGYTLSFGMPQKLTSGGNSGAVVMSAEASAETFATAQPSAVTAQIDSKAEMLAAKAEAEHPETVLEKISSRLTYENVHSDTNVVYDLDSNRVKESIVLAKQDDTLRGYRYTLNAGPMVPVLQDDGSIIFYAPDAETVVMVMPAPYLQDNALAISTDVSVTLTGKGSQYILTYTLPQSWLAAEDRQWPVILDPVIEADLDVKNIQDAVIASNHTYSYTNPYLDVGYGSTYGIKRSFVKYTEIPPLTSADVVVSATMSMVQMYYRAVSIPAEVHKVKENWSSQDITWEEQPDYDETVVDFVMGNDVEWYHWDVTDIVQDWYNTGNNYGMMFKSPDSVENGGVEKYRQFVSSDYGVSYHPALQIRFLNNNGLQGYWDYSSASAGRAGTGSVNIYTGNLVWTRNDMGFGGNRMPVTIDFAYNTNDAANNSFGMGYGWRSSFNQLVYQWDEDGDGTVQSDEEHYIWEDADGTSHYFKYDSEEGKITETDGLEMVLTKPDSGDSKYILTDKNDNTWHFDTQGRLYKQENNQSTKSNITITYEDAASKQIKTVTDGAGRKYTFTYNESGFLTKVSFVGTGTDEITYVQYSYENGDLKTVTYKDGETVTYAYTDSGKHLLESATDIDGYQLIYTYNTPTENSDTENSDTENCDDEFAPPRIASVEEEHRNIKGGKLSFQYEQNQTMLQSSYGGTADATLYYQFNNWGNTVAILDDQGRAQYADFARNEPDDTAGKGNQLTLSSKLQNTVINLLSDSSFEGDTVWTAVTGLTEVSGSVVATEHYLGAKALSVSGGCLRSAGFTAEAGKTYAFSGYVKASSGEAKLGIGDINGENAQWSLPAHSDDGWVRVQVSYTNNTESNQTVYALFHGTTAYLDCVQLEEMPTASRYNLVNNGDFNTNSGWEAVNLSNGDTVTAAPTDHVVLSGTAYKITGDHTTEKAAKQTITVSGGDGDSFVFGGWAMGQSASLEKYPNGVTKDFSIKCTIYNGTEVVKEEKVQFNPNVTQWQFVSGAIASTGDYTSITIEAVFENNANTVYFDGLQLFKEEFGTTYTYDDEGNVKSVVDLQKTETKYEFRDNNLTQIIQDDKVKMTYDYDNHHNVINATTEEGYVYEFDYDDYGNNTSVSITEKTENENAKKISSSAAYTSDHNQLASTTDALGNVTQYGYNLQTGLLEWVQYPEDGDNPTTENVDESNPICYTYDEMYRKATIAADQYINDADTGLDFSVSYTYEDDLLNTIQTPKTTYNFEYGNFALRSIVWIGTSTSPDGGYTLAEYGYNNQNRLTTLDYGNGDKVEYTYDSQGRLIQEKYDGKETVSYQYDNAGNLATVTDSETGVVTTYYYDLLNRGVGYREQGENYDHSVTYIYDDENNLSSMTETVNGAAKKYTYTYNEDNQLISETVGDVVDDTIENAVTITYTYDGFGRVCGQSTALSSSVTMTEVYSFTSPEAGKSSNQVSHHRYQIGTSSKYNAYTYDDNGNIQSIRDSYGFVESYVYDSQGQLIWEYSENSGYATNWAYDNAGNIVSRKVYTYEFYEVGELVEEVTYTYGDDQWGDLLTAYDGKPIDYDAIGNPETYDGWTFTWQHGRELVSMAKNSTTWEYTYNANGLRTKRTNGTDTYNYIYNGSKLVAMTKGNDTLYFSYDASGSPLTVDFNGTIYYYQTNLQGDVIAILNSAGTAVVNYTYDAWGKLLQCTGTLANTLGTLNPLRYRGYVYDSETGLYYLQSRYYNPEWGRFINADIFYSTGQGFVGNNMFAYCLNNPTNMADYNGYDAIYVIDKKLGRGLPIVGHAILYIQDENGNWYMTDYSGQFPDKSTAHVRFVPADMEVVNAILQEEEISHINYVYIEGDFSKSIEAAKQYDGTTYNGYNIFNNNCQDYTQEILNNGAFSNPLERFASYISPAFSPAAYGRALNVGSKVSSLINAIVDTAEDIWNEIKSWLK